VLEVEVKAEAEVKVEGKPDAVLQWCGAAVVK